MVGVEVPRTKSCWAQHGRSRCACAHMVQGSEAFGRAPTHIHSSMHSCSWPHVPLQACTAACRCRPSPTLPAPPSPAPPLQSCPLNWPHQPAILHLDGPQHWRISGNHLHEHKLGTSPLLSIYMYTLNTCGAESSAHTGCECRKPPGHKHGASIGGAFDGYDAANQVCQ